MFKKLVAIEPVSLVPWAEKQLWDYAEEVILYSDIPKSESEVVRRIGDADAVLVSYTTTITRAIIEQCPQIRYIGMCCSLYSEESANVDIASARERRITVLGIRDYGDRGVVEFALSELVRFLHGLERPMLEDIPREITGLNVGMLGFGVSGAMIGEALKFLGANVSYYCRSPKPEREAQGFVYRPLMELLKENQVIFACLNKNVILLGEEEFKAMGEGKILFNTSIGPAHDIDALSAWLKEKNNYFVCDTVGALGSEQLLQEPNVFCAGVSVGRTKQAFELLSQKVLDNIKAAEKCLKTQ